VLVQNFIYDSEDLFSELEEEIRAAGFQMKSIRTFLAGSFAAVGAERPA